MSSAGQVTLGSPILNLHYYKNIKMVIIQGHLGYKLHTVIRTQNAQKVPKFIF